MVEKESSSALADVLREEDTSSAIPRFFAIIGPLIRCSRRNILKLIISVASLCLLANPLYAEFSDRLLLEDVAHLHENDGDYDPGHTEFKLLADYSYTDAQGNVWTVPAGYVVNGASIPRAVWASVGGPWSGKYRNASVVHDYLTAERFSSSKIVHRLFYDGMIESGVSTARAKLMYAAVVIGGGKWSDVPGFTGAEGPREISPDQVDQLRGFIAVADPSLSEIEALEHEDIK